MTEAYNMDCMELMKRYPDNYFQLAVVDPPYGEGKTARSDSSGCAWKRTDGSRFGGHFDRYNPTVQKVRGGTEISCTRTGGRWAAKYAKKIVAWDNAPSKEYFDELFRVSEQQIIWGGNYFGLPPTRCFLIWDKQNISDTFSMAMCEYAWTSFNENAKMFRVVPQNMNFGTRFHPTEKPMELYAWIYNLFAKPGYRILDTHLGSGSSRLAAYDAGLDFVGCEIDEEYFKKQEERFANYTAQTSLFIGG